MNVAIAIPTHDYVPAEFAWHLARMTTYTAMQSPEDFEFTIQMVSGTVIQHARESLLKDILTKTNADYVLWIDSDMTFPMESLIQLLSRGEPFVGVNYSKRQVEADYVAFKTIFTEPDEDGKVPPSIKCETTLDSTGIEEVDGLGFGMFLMRTAELMDLPDPKKTPWFHFERLPDGKNIGEDIWFCRLIREMGHKIYVDHDLSKLCGHIGQFTYRLDHVWTHKDYLASVKAEASSEGEDA